MTPRLKSLELNGYKTFASRTVFEFAESITAVVGPNGSGKSNIADALRWVLGEQSYSLLRGKKTDDMIFAGSESRPRAGMASATVTFDNSEGWLPIDFSEVSIARRAYRDGQNEYLINNQKVRLRDVTEMLASSGLAERTYTIIGQGLVDAALSLKPEERRRLFEEAAGIGLYRTRKEQALRRLETTERNIDRAQDILAELTPRLNSLERQARRAHEYEQVRADLREILREWYGFHWHNAQRELRKVREEAMREERSLEQARQRQADFDTKLAGLREQSNGLRARLNGWHRQLAELHIRRESTGRDLAVAEERRRYLAERLTGLSAEVLRSDEEEALQQPRYDEAAARQESLRNELAEAQSRAASAHQSPDDSGVTPESAVQAFNHARQTLVDLHTRLGSVQAEFQKAQQEFSGAAQLQRSARQSLDEAHAQYHSLTMEYEQVISQLELQRGQAAAVEGEMARAIDRLVQISGEFQGFAAVLKSAEETLRQKAVSLSKADSPEGQDELRHWEMQAALRRQALSDAEGILQERRQALEKVQARLSELQTLRNSLEAEQSELIARMSEVRGSEGTIGEEIAALQDLIQPAEAELSRAEAEHESLLQSEAGSRRLLMVAERHHTQAQVAFARQQESLDTLRRRIEDDFGLVAFDYDDSVSGPTPLPLGDLVERLPVVAQVSPELEQALQRQRAQLRRMGTINPDAQREHQEVKERHQFLTVQLADLHVAEEDVRQVIAELDVLMEREFRKTFDAVANEFRDIFTRLFGGGSARLILAESEDANEVGIDIEARLPGKRGQRLALLSGGERSLTAAALVFSLLKASPTPFCVMDEVDAMLDEANVGRFRELLSEMSQATQFVLITHNRNTVQAADVIYGVTMGRDTASQVISLKVEEVDERYSA